MMIRSFFGIVIFVVALFYLSYLNPETLQIHLTPGTTVPIYTSLLILSSIMIGAFLMMSVVAFRDTRRGIFHWREKGRLKKKEKAMDLYRLGVNNLLSKKREDALKNFQKILEWDPKHLDALLRIGEVYRYKGDLNQAIRYHNQARSREPQNLSVLFALGKDFRRAGRAEEAAEIYRTILKIDARNELAFLKLRELYENQKAWARAGTLQEGYWGLKKDPQEKKRLIYYQVKAAGLLDPVKDRDKIIKTYSDAIKSDRTFAAPYVELGKVYRAQGNDKEAVKIWKKGFLETGVPVFLEVLDQYYREREDPGSIIKIYKEAVNRHPDNPTFKFLLGKFYYRLEMIDDALEIFEQLRNQGIRFPILRRILGDIYHKRGRTEDAFSEYNASVNFIRPVLVPYSCTQCGNEQEEWGPRCPQCNRLDTLNILLPLPEQSTPQTRHD